MVEEKKKRLLAEITGRLSYYHHKKIMDYSKENKVCVTMIVACLLDQAIEAGFKFEYDLTIPPENENSNMFGEEGAKILKFLEPMYIGVGLDTMMVMRHDMNISKIALLNVIGDCLRSKKIEPIKPKGRANYADDYRYYRLTKEKGYETKRKRKHRSKVFTLEEEIKELKAKLKERE